MMRRSGLIGAVIAAGALLGGCNAKPRVVVRDLPIDGITESSAKPGSLVSRPTPKPKPKPGPVAGKPSHPEWAPTGVFARPWKWIVVHHSASGTGSAAAFDRMHRARGWDELGYHFVINNGTGQRDGKVEVGPRWAKQKWGAHCKTPDNAYNDYGIGICLVGDWRDRLPSQAQRRQLRELVFFLADHYGIDAAHVIGHNDAPGTKTQCPGQALRRYVHTNLRDALITHQRLARDR